MSGDAIEVDTSLDAPALVPGGTASLRFRMTTRAPLRIRGAHAHFIGYEETRAVFMVTTGKTTTPSVATERHVLVEKRETFHGQAPAGFFRDLVDGALTLMGGGDHTELPAGSHDVVLAVDLPAVLPESFAGEKAKVVYAATITLDIPAGRDFKHEVEIPVARPSRDRTVSPEPVTIRYPDDAGRGFFDKVFGPDVSMHLDLPTTVVPRGDTLSGALDVHFPDKPATVESVVCQLIRQEHSTAHGHEDRHTETAVTEKVVQRRGPTNHLFSPFDVRLPGTLIPTCRGAKFSVTYELAVSLEVPGAKDQTVRVPVTVV